MDVIAQNEPAEVEAVESTEVEAKQAKGLPPPKDDAAQIKKFEEQARIPGWATDYYNALKEERELIHTKVFADNKDYAVTTNWIYRNQQVKLSQLWPGDPTLAASPRRQVGGTLPMHEAFAETSEIIGDFLFKKARGADAFSSAMQDAMTNGICWVKCTWTEDLSRDPCGHRAVSDQQDQTLRMHRLMDQWENNEFDEEDERYAELIQMTEYVVNGALDQMRDLASQGADAQTDPRMGRLQSLAILPTTQPIPSYLIPEVKRFLGVCIEVYQAEHVRLDWWIKDPNLWWMSSHVTFVNYLSKDEICDRWTLSDEEKGSLGTDSKIDCVNKQMGMSAGANNSKDDPAQAEPDAAVVGGRVAVYERWDRITQRMYIWAKGMTRFFYDEIIEVSWSGFFPCEPIFYNRASGRFAPISDTKLQFKLQEELNQLATDDREARMAAYNRFIIKAGNMTPEEKRKLRMSRPHEVIEMENAEDIKKDLQTITGSRYNPALSDRERARADMDAVAGVPAQAAGLTGEADFAAEVEVAAASMNSQLIRMMSTVRRALGNVFQMILEYAGIALPTENAMEIAGPMAVWPVFDRMQLIAGMDLNVTVGTNGKPNVKKEMEAVNLLLDLVLKLNAADPMSPPLTVDKRKIFDQAVSTMGYTRMVRGTISQVAPMVAPGMNPGGPGGLIPPLGGPGGPGAPMPPPGPLIEAGTPGTTAGDAPGIAPVRGLPPPP
ncbi:hypothetical protein UFOVP141_2 [uncultured Caudovirales phage]|uniref:Portal protein n=1 Tax=uncultured Caudovirales phage TaxID=2100421 RepID=A0A6J7VP58_9CAUD|nr:hypothetical protein UFOVP141_2 [uncultured Caudovirales phage]